MHRLCGAGALAREISALEFNPHKDLLRFQRQYIHCSHPASVNLFSFTASNQLKQGHLHIFSAILGLAIRPACACADDFVSPQGG
jgi:hypothetical protein